MVVGAAGPMFWVRVGDRDVVCSLRGRLKKVKQQATSLAVVGDQVEVMLLPDGGGAIEAVMPRRTVLGRPAPRGRTHVVAANLDQLVIVQATHQPEFNRHLVERFLALASRGRMQALVIVNKCDLEAPAAIEDSVASLRASDVPVLLTSAKLGRGIEELRAALSGKLSAMAGHSGVGKSSLVNALDPQFAVRVSEVATLNHKGRHTTSASRLYALAGGGHLIDTPGIRELALFEDDPPAVVAQVFPEIEEAAGLCRFRGCSHSHEPGCAVKQLVASGAIEEDRYRNFLKLSAGGGS